MRVIINNEFNKEENRKPLSLSGRHMIKRNIEAVNILNKQLERLLTLNDESSEDVSDAYVIDSVIGAFINDIKRCALYKNEETK